MTKSKTNDSAPKSTETEAAAPAPARNLVTIDGDFCLLWPEGFEDRLRARSQTEAVRALAAEKIAVDVPHYIIDLDAPLERELFCHKQEHKLRPLTVDEAKRYTEPTEIENPAALALLRDLAEGRDVPVPKPPTVDEVTAENAVAASAWMGDGPDVIPDAADAPPPKGSEPKAATEEPANETKEVTA